MRKRTVQSRVEANGRFKIELKQMIVVIDGKYVRTCVCDHVIYSAVYNTIPLRVEINEYKTLTTSQ